MKLPIKLVGRFRSDESGAVAIIFALCLMMMMFMMATAIDAARAWKTQIILQDALDATALATARAIRLEGLEDAQLKERAESFFKASFKDRSSAEAVVQTLKLEIDRANTIAKVSALVALPAYISPIMNINKFDIAQSASARFDAKDIELAMMLDVSGSMAGKKLADLKSASSELVEIILKQNEDGAKHRIGVAPYSSAVNAGTYALAATGKPDGNSCVTERKNAKSLKDGNPKKGKFDKKSATCPTSEILPLSSDPDTVTAHINAFSANGSTAGHLGIGWSWYLLSPDWTSVWPGASAPVDYESKDAMKVAIIMTDGEFNTAYETGNGDSIEQSKALCDGMKEAGIKLYSIGFQAPAGAVPILKYCASAANDFFDAADGDSLRRAFKDIADDVMA